MKYLLVLVFVALGFTAQDQEPRHDKFKDDPNARCFYSPEGTPYPDYPSMHPCACHQTCVTQADGSRLPAEDPKCELYCTKQRCACHVDEDVCDVPDLPDVEPGAPR